MSRVLQFIYGLEKAARGAIAEPELLSKFTRTLGPASIEPGNVKMGRIRPNSAGRARSVLEGRADHVLNSLNAFERLERGGRRHPGPNVVEPMRAKPRPRLETDVKPDGIVKANSVIRRAQPPPVYLKLAALASGCICTALNHPDAVTKLVAGDGFGFGLQILVPVLELLRHHETRRQACGIVLTIVSNSLQAAEEVNCSAYRRDLAAAALSFSSDPLIASASE